MMYLFKVTRSFWVTGLGAETSIVRLYHMVAGRKVANYYRRGSGFCVHGQTYLAEMPPGVDFPHARDVVILASWPVENSN